MPELPEVETTVRELRVPLVGRTIQGVRSDWPKHLAETDIGQFNERIRGSRIQAIGRRGKYLLFSLDNGETLIIHLKMSGHLSVVDRSSPTHKHDHTVFLLDNDKELRFRDQRKFGRVILSKQPDQLFSGLGPEPLDAEFTVQCLEQRLEGRTRALKTLLLDQGFIAGIGNIYANEALFHARVRPERAANTLSAAEVEALHKAIRFSLARGLENGGASIDLYLKPDGTKGSMQDEFAVHGRAQQPCFRCGSLIQRKVMGGRSAFFCPSCQE